MLTWLLAGDPSYVGIVISSLPQTDTIGSIGTPYPILN